MGVKVKKFINEVEKSIGIVCKKAKVRHTVITEYEFSPFTLSMNIRLVAIPARIKNKKMKRSHIK